MIVREPCQASAEGPYCLAAPSWEGYMSEHLIGNLDMGLDVPGSQIKGLSGQCQETRLGMRS